MPAAMTPESRAPCWRSVCGVQSFYEPRSHPGSKAVTVQCLDPGTVQSVRVLKCDGANWEQFMAKHDRAASTS
jgi:hypothetical protein